VVRGHIRQPEHIAYCNVDYAICQHCNLSGEFYTVPSFRRLSTKQSDRINPPYRQHCILQDLHSTTHCILQVLECNSITLILYDCINKPVSTCQVLHITRRWATCTVLVIQYHCGQTFSTHLVGGEGRSPVRRESRAWLCAVFFDAFGKFLENNSWF